MLSLTPASGSQLQQGCVCAVLRHRSNPEWWIEGPSPSPQRSATALVEPSPASTVDPYSNCTPRGATLIPNCRCHLTRRNSSCCDPLIMTNCFLYHLNRGHLTLHHHGHLDNLVQELHLWEISSVFWTICIIDTESVNLHDLLHNLNCWTCHCCTTGSRGNHWSRTAPHFPADPSPSTGSDRVLPVLQHSIDELRLRYLCSLLHLQLETAVPLTVCDRSDKLVGATLSRQVSQDCLLTLGWNWCCFVPPASRCQDLVVVVHLVHVGLQLALPRCFALHWTHQECTAPDAHCAELAGWVADPWAVVLNCCSATMYGLRVCLWLIGLGHYVGHPQPPQRTGHGCTVGVNRDPPVWLSIQAGWWRNQSASLTYTGRRSTIRRSTISRRRGIYTCAPTEREKKKTEREKEKKNYWKSEREKKLVEKDREKEKNYWKGEGKQPTEKKRNLLKKEGYKKNLPKKKEKERKNNLKKKEVEKVKKKKKTKWKRSKTKAKRRKTKWNKRENQVKQKREPSEKEKKLVQKGGKSWSKRKYLVKKRNNPVKKKRKSYKKKPSGEKKQKRKTKTCGNKKTVEKKGG